MSQSGAVRKPWEMVDVLILTALQDEYDAVLQEDVDVLPGSSWERRMGPLGLEVALRTFRGQGGGTLRVAVTRIRENGGVAPAYAAAPLVRVFSPRCLAVCGVCSSRQDVPYRLIDEGDGGLGGPGLGRQGQTSRCSARRWGRAGVPPL